MIFVELAGGPSQFETYDPKPNAPAEFRGPMSAIATNLPGVSFGQTMVEQARIADRLTILRSIQHKSSSHDPSSHLTQRATTRRDRRAAQRDAMHRRGGRAVPWPQSPRAAGLLRPCPR